MIRATWDTNALASGAIAREGAIAELIDRWRRGDFEIVVSEHVLTELERTLGKPYFRIRLPEVDRKEFLALVRRFATVTPVTDPIPAVLTHRGDNIVLATAISAGTAIIVSGDREMQRLDSYRSLRSFPPELSSNTLPRSEGAPHQRGSTGRR